MQNGVLISVIIPTYRDWESLQLCLEALLEQDIGEQNFEVIVINNDASTEIPSTLPAAQNTRFFTETRPGSYAARNRGVRESRGHILAFTDADCLPRPNWLSSAIRYFQEEDAERLAGNVIITFEDESRSFSQIYEKAYSFRQRDNVAKGVSVTANFFVKKSTFLDIGLFNQALLSGGDMEWNRRASDVGVRIRYADDCVVTHTARVLFEDVLKKNRRITGGMATMNNGVFAILKCLIPPINKLSVLSGRSDLSLFEKAVAFLMLCLLRLHSIFVRLRLKCNLEKPERS